MAYVRVSRSRGKDYRQIVESYCEVGKVKQRVLVSLPKHADTLEHAAESCEEVAKNERELAARVANEVAEMAEHRAKLIERRREAGYNTSYLNKPYSGEKRARKQGEEYARKAEKNAHKAKVIRELLESGKIKPDTPELRDRARATWR